ncbi:MAG: tetratricopeptide repeat protein [Magnetovibrionaceae bacterium]
MIFSGERGLIRRFLIAVLIGPLLGAPTLSPAHAMSSDLPSPNQPKELIEARQLIVDKQFAAAVQPLTSLVKDQPNEPEFWNLLGYSQRKAGDFDAALQSYSKALDLDPRHRGALQYLGMLYLETGQMEQAKEMLERLDDSCFFGCKEFSALEAAIEAGNPGNY